MYRPSLAEPKANLSGCSEQVECLCDSAVQFDFGSNRLSAVFFFECPMAEGLGLFPTQWAVFGSFGRPKELPLLWVVFEAEGLG